ncbi:rCG59139 [Rattus norvegicus]|uniref:RCG59139 n=1 Tax=Rattus norvegicus TaxID=10116 RepID=A6KIU4_RAT|nr:rCG59139 [Rattus norvegicus]
MNHMPASRTGAGLVLVCCRRFSLERQYDLRRDPFTKTSKS